jgi:hypothetical protein
MNWYEWPAVALPPPPPRNRAERRNVMRANGVFKKRGRKW